MSAFAGKVERIVASCHECGVSTKPYPNNRRNREMINRWADKHDAENGHERSLLDTSGRLPMNGE